MTTEERLNVLERKVIATRRLLAVAGLLAVAAIGIASARWKTNPSVLPSSTSPIPEAPVATSTEVQEPGACKEIRGQRLVLEDRNGEERLKFTALEDGPLLTFYYSGGVMASMVDFASLPMAPALSISDRSGKHRVVMTVDDVGTYLILSDKYGMKPYTAR